MSSAPISTRFPNLTIPSICTADPAQIAAQTILEYELDFLQIKEIAKTLAPGDPTRILLLRCAYREMQLRNLINYGYQQNSLIAAVGSNLDALGTLYGVGPGIPGLSSGLNGQRLPGSFASTTILFTITSPAPNTPVVIAKGTLVATAGNGGQAGVQFSTSADLVLPIGTTSGTVDAQCTQIGTIGNGFVAGQVNQPVAWQYPYVVSISNTTQSAGGFPAEDDDDYAIRMSMLPGAFSVAGPASAYRAWSFTANAGIGDVAVITPNTTPSVAAGNIALYILMKGGSLPNSSILNQVLATFANDKRPQGDVVSAFASIAVPFSVNFTYYIDPANVTIQPTIDAAVKVAAQTFAVYCMLKNGRTISRAYLYELVELAGASDVVAISPPDTPIALNQVGQFTGNMTVTYGGTRIA